MSRVMLLVSSQGATLAETKVYGEGPEADALAEEKLREAARTKGLDGNEVRSARVAFAGDPPNQP